MSALSTTVTDFLDPPEKALSFFPARVFELILSILNLVLEGILYSLPIFLATILIEAVPGLGEDASPEADATAMSLVVMKSRSLLDVTIVPDEIIFLLSLLL